MPKPSYPNLQLDDLEAMVRLFDNGIADAEDIHEIVDAFEETALELLAAVPGALRSAELQLEREDNHTWRQLATLCQKGSGLLNEGLNELELYLLNPGQGAQGVLEKLRASNDCLCHSANLVQELFQRAA